MELINEIKSDVLMGMTENLIRAFRIKGCDPACHCCNKKIEAGDKFKLAEVKAVVAGSFYEDAKLETNDEMLCGKCTPVELANSRKKQRKRDKSRWMAGRTGGFTRKHAP